MRTSNFKLFWSMLKNIRSNAMNREMTGYSIEEKLPPITREDILAYAAATLDNNPAYDGPDPAAPPFLLGKLLIPIVKDIWVHPDLGLNLLRTVQIYQSTKWHHPLKVNDVITLRSRIKNIYDAPQGEIIELSGVGLVGGQPVVEGEIGFMVKNKKPSTRIKNGVPEQPAESFRIEIQTKKGQQLKYADVTGDSNFIHTSDFLAKKAGLPGAIMHGACVMAMSCSALTSKVAGNDISRLESISGQFGRPVIPGQKLTIVGYQAAGDREFPFEVLNPMNKPVFKKGILCIR